MSDEKLKILEMLQQGIINAQEANDLLEALGQSEPKRPVFQVYNLNKPVKALRKFMHLTVIPLNRKEINIKLPIEFISMIKKFDTSKSIDDETNNLIQDLFKNLKEEKIGEIFNFETKDGTKIIIKITEN